MIDVEDVFQVYVSVITELIINMRNFRLSLLHSLHTSKGQKHRLVNIKSFYSTVDILSIQYTC